MSNISMGYTAGSFVAGLASVETPNPLDPRTGIMHGFLNDESLKISREEATEMYLILTFASADTNLGD